MILVKKIWGGQQKSLAKKHNGGLSRGRVCGTDCNHMISSNTSHWSGALPPSLIKKEKEKEKIKIENHPPLPQKIIILQPLHKKIMIFLSCNFS